MKYLIMILIMVITSPVLAYQSQQSNNTQRDKAIRTQKCGLRYTDCQSQCVHIQLVNSSTRPITGSPIPCDPKNQLISQCRNNCYNIYQNCLGN